MAASSSGCGCPRRSPTASRPDRSLRQAPHGDKIDAAQLAGADALASCPPGHRQPPLIVLRRWPTRAPSMIAALAPPPRRSSRRRCHRARAAADQLAADIRRIVEVPVESAPRLRGAPRAGAIATGRRGSIMIGCQRAADRSWRNSDLDDIRCHSRACETSHPDARARGAFAPRAPRRKSYLAEPAATAEQIDADRTPAARGRDRRRARHGQRRTEILRRRSANEHQDRRAERRRERGLHHADLAHFRGQRRLQHQDARRHLQQRQRHRPARRARRAQPQHVRHARARRVFLRRDHREDRRRQLRPHQGLVHDLRSRRRGGRSSAAARRSTSTTTWS